jgi:uncharacterized membrane protein
MSPIKDKLPIEPIKDKIHNSRVHIHKAHYEEHPDVRTGEDLTIGERLADIVRNSMGSWSFIIVFLCIIGVWVAVNNVLVAFDAYPFILLNLILSTMAGLQAGILLIAAKRADRVAAETAGHTVQNTEIIKTLLEQNTQMTEMIEQLTRELHDTVLKQDAGQGIDIENLYVIGGEHEAR